MGKVADWFANKNREPDGDVLSKGVVWNAKGEMVSCLFCDFVQHRKEKEILFEDDLVAAFAPLKPAAKQHILVIPKKHLSTVGDLAPEDSAVLDRMRVVAEQLLKCDPSAMRFSFHIPPWNSIGETLHRCAYQGNQQSERYNSLLELDGKKNEKRAKCVCIPRWVHVPTRVSTLCTYVLYCCTERTGLHLICQNLPRCCRPFLRQRIAILL